MHDARWRTTTRDHALEYPDLVKDQGQQVALLRWAIAQHRRRKIFARLRPIGLWIESRSVSIRSKTVDVGPEPPVTQEDFLLSEDLNA